MGVGRSTALPKGCSDKPETTPHPQRAPADSRASWLPRHPHLTFEPHFWGIWVSSVCETGSRLRHRVGTALWQLPALPAPHHQTSNILLNPAEIPPALPCSPARSTSQCTQLFNLLIKHSSTILEKAMMPCCELHGAGEFALLLSDLCQRPARTRTNRRQGFFGSEGPGNAPHNRLPCPGTRRALPPAHLSAFNLSF